MGNPGDAVGGELMTVEQPGIETAIAGHGGGKALTRLVIYALALASASSQQANRPSIDRLSEVIGEAGSDIG